MADKPDKTIDPYEVEALEKSLNDSATRVSTIWVSFLIFSLYLVIAAATVTHRQLFLAEPVKLPVLNIDLPLWGFFFLAPILFVIFHAYVLIQLILLARTALGYNEALDYKVRVDSDNARIRQRLANTLFAQIFAGSPRERHGWLGWCLKAMAWVTLAIAPILILLTFQFMFLPYHSHLATWTHRCLIFAELAAIFWLWPLVFNAHKDFQYRKIRRQFLRGVSFPVWLLSPWDTRQVQWKRIKQNTVPLVSCAVAALASLLIGTFPGEPHLNVIVGDTWSSVQCERWFAQTFDRLNLPRIDVVDDDKLSKIEIAATAKELSAFRGERTQSFRERDLRCGVFREADLRRTDFTNAKMFGADLSAAELQGTVLDFAELGGATLSSAKLQDAALRDVQLQSSNLLGASLQGAILTRAELQSADFSYSTLVGAYMGSTNSHRAKFTSADLQFANLNEARLYGADFSGADLRGAELGRARMQAVSLSNAKLQGADFFQTQLQGADLSTAQLSLSSFSNTYLWRSVVSDCGGSRVADAILSPIVDIIRGDSESLTDEDATPVSVEALVHEIVTYASSSSKEELLRNLRSRFDLEKGEPESAEIWRTCAENAITIDEYDLKLGRYLGSLVCSAEDDHRYMTDGLMFKAMSRSMSLDLQTSQTFLGAVADNMLAIKPCPALAKATETLRKWLERSATTAVK